MNIAITGHTKGIGKSIHNLLKDQGYNVKGLSRSNSYDITNANIVEEIKDYNVFINNAYAPIYQTLILKNILEEWKDKDKIIINIGSKLSFNGAAKDQKLDQYIKDKREQNEICIAHSMKGYPKVCNIILGLVDTDMSKVFKTERKMDTESVAKVILNLLNEQQIWTQQIVLESPGLDWQAIEIGD